MMTYKARVLDKVVVGEYGIRVGVFRSIGDEDELIGEYIRHYSSFYNTFFHFKSNGLDLALYSPQYSATRILALPECVDLGGEEPSGSGFCPVEFFVPTYVEIVSIDNYSDAPRRSRRNNPNDEELLPQYSTWEYRDSATGSKMKAESNSFPVTPRLYYPFGFVAGCIWGDESTWKVQYLDLSRAAEGIVHRDDRFGYIELPSGMSLAQAVEMEDFGDDPNEDYSYQISIALRRTFDIRDGKSIKRG
jgi:hypothetical protein